MSEPAVDITSSEAWRSKKYKALSNEDILELAVKKLNDKDTLYLSRELDCRNLHQAAKDARLRAAKKRMFSGKPKWKIIIPIVIGIVFFIRKMWLNMGI